MTFLLTTGHLLWRMRHVHHASEVVAVGGESVSRSSFPDTAERAGALANGLQVVYDLDHGSVVSVLAFNTRQHLEILLGVPALGAVVESVNVRTTADTIEAQLRASCPRVVIIDQEVLDHAVAGPAAHAVLDSCEAAGRPTLIVDSRSGSGLEQVIAIGRTVHARTEPTSEHDQAYLFHTSGTTGPPKTYAVTHRDAVLHALSQATTAATGLRTQDRVLPLAPFFHVNGWGLALTCAITGSSLVLTGAEMKPNAVVDVLTDHEVTVAAAVPTVWHDICEAAGNRHGLTAKLALREVLTGGSPVPEPVALAIEEVLGACVVAAWGMTETMACSTYERNDPGRAVGKPVPLLETRVVHGDTPALPGHQGRLQVRGAFVIGHEDGGWLDTADIASIDGDGRIRMHDREKDLIKSGGEWIVSAELEQALCAHPAVSLAAVIARPDPRWIERPVAYVVPRAGAAPESVSTADLRTTLARLFPKWWLPDDIVVIDSLPLTAVGKVDKAALRREQSVR